jgi:N-methylhydantoinase A
MTRLINMDNGGTLTDFCLIDGEEVRYTRTLTTPYGLSRCLLDSLAKVSELAYGEPQLATRAVHRLHPVFHHPGHQRSRAAGRTAAMPAGRRSDAGRGPGGHLGPGGSADGTGRRPGGPDQPGHRRGGAEPRAARAGQRPVRARGPAIAVSGADGEARVRGLLLRLSPSSARRDPTAVLLELVAGPDDIRRTWPDLLNAFVQPAMERFLFNADRRLRDAPARQPSRIFRRRLTACSPRPGRA